MPSGIKLTYNDVKSFIESNRGYKLISTEYIRAHGKLKIQCNKGHEFEMSFANFQQGYRCASCSGNKKLTIEDVRKYIEKNGNKLLSTEYINSKHKLKMMCHNGHIFDMTLDNFKQGKRCHVCKEQRHSFEYVKSFIEKENYQLLSTEYKNNTSKLKLLCPYNHEFKISFASFKRGTRCSICYLDRIKTIFNSDEFKFYRLKVDNLTQKNYRKYKHLINPNNLQRGRYKYHLDHKYSIYDGFINNVPIEVIASINNLQILSEYNNLSKSKNSCISLEELLKIIKEK